MTPKLTTGLITQSWQLKLAALGLAVLFWAAVQSEDLRRFTMTDVPVEVRMTERGWVPVGLPDPATVSVDFAGPVGELVRLAFAEAKLVVPVDDVEDSVELYRPREEWLEYEGRFQSLRVEQMRPLSLTLRFQPIETRMVPVAVRLDSPLKRTTRLAEPPTADPARVLVEGPRDRVQTIDSLIVRVADVERALRNGAVRLRIDTTGIGVSVSPREVIVRLRVLPPDSVLPDTSTEARRP
ncbi:MAG TPA: hypothetical protein VMN78_08030 [Longimicrobiales bacterium]|nr:hypothetical protein [Longimicrobiales bacterium]